MTLKLIIYSLLILLSPISFAMDEQDEGSSTETVDLDFDEADFEPIEETELEEDLKDPSSVRFQISANMKITEPSTKENASLLLFPVFCVGTGRYKDRLEVSHLKPTFVRLNDTAVDCQKEFCPDIVKDGLAISGLSDKYPQETFGVVFFAHAGKTLLFSLKDNEIQKSLETYFKWLKPKGLFIYNSEALVRSDKVISTLLHICQLKEFKDLEGAWRQLLGNAGFKDIAIVIKNESPVYGDEAFSFLIIARKP